MTLLLLPVAAGWVLWLAWRSDVHTAAWRRWFSTALRLVMVCLLILAVAGLQWLKPQEGMNVFFLLDRSDSVPSSQQEAAREFVGRLALSKKKEDKVGILIFGSEASIESSPLSVVDKETGKIFAVVDGQRTDIASAIRLGSAAFPETGQKRLVLLSDGNENIGDALAAAVQARTMDISIDATPMGVTRTGDISVQKVSLPTTLKEGQTFDVKIFAQADAAQDATVQLFLNDQMLGQQRVTLEAGKNLFTFPQTLDQPGFYAYDVRIETRNDAVPQNNRAINFSTVRGNPRVLIVSSDPVKDATLAAALQSSRLTVELVDIGRFPGTLAEMQSYDSIVLCNVAAGDLGDTLLRLLESAVRDFGVGLVCVGGDQAYAAGGYRGTPLDRILPVDMELSSKKVLPPGAVVLLMHGMEFNNGNQVARDCAIGVLEALGPQDEMGVLMWDGVERWLFELQAVGDKRDLRRRIQGMNQGDLPSFQGLMSMAHKGLQKSSASLKHVIVFSDGDPGAPGDDLMAAMAGDRITVSTVLISGHAGPDTMIQIAEQGRGRFYNVTSPAELPQIFIKEAAVVLKSAIHEEPFRPQVVALSELTRGIAAAAYPNLQGYVATTQKPRAETPLFTEKGDPLLAHWQFGLGRAVAFTSDAQPRWASAWLGWGQYRQFWSQIVNWSLRKLENANLTAEVSVEEGEGVLSVEAVDAEGDYRNFLDLRATVVSPEGERQTVTLQQTGSGHYEARFPTREVGAYLVNLAELENGAPRASLVVGASVNYSPEFTSGAPNQGLLRRITEITSGRMLDPVSEDANPFLHDRQKTYQPRDLFEWLLKCAILLFPLDVGVRRIDIDRTEWAKATRTLRRWLLFWRGEPRPAEADESLAALLARRDQIRAKRDASQPTAPAAELFQPAQPVNVPTAASEHVAPAPQETPTLPTSPSENAPASSKPTPASTASRLLEAKRRAQQRRR
jgi:uncharacterized membrane protein